MPFEFIKNIVARIKKFDVDVNDYKKLGKNPYIPALAYVNWAIHLAEEGNFDEAEEKLLHSTLMAHQTPESYINLGLLKTKVKDFPAAMGFYTKALHLDNNNAKAYCFLGNTLTELQEFAEAEKNFKTAQKIEPNNSDILLNWGIALVRQKKLGEAQEKFQKACQLNVTNFMALYFWALVELEKEEYLSAKAKFQLIVSVLPNHNEAWYYLAYIKFKEKNYQESLIDALKALEISTQKIETYMLLGENYMLLKDEVNCLKHYALGANAAKINYHFLNSWGLALQEFNRPDEAKEKFTQAIELNSQNELAMAQLGVLFYNAGNLEQAIEFFEKTLAMNARNLVAIENLGRICFDKHEYQHSIEYFAQALKISAKAVHNYYNIAQAHELAGDIKKSNEFYEKSLEYQPENLQAYIDFAKSLVEQKNYKIALRYVRRANKMDETNVECLNLLFYVNYILAKENLYDYNIKEAIEIANKIEENYPGLFIYKNEKEELESARASKNIASA